MLQRSRPFVIAHCGRDRHNCPVRWSEICVSRALSTPVLTPRSATVIAIAAAVFPLDPHSLLVDSNVFCPYSASPY